MKTEYYKINSDFSLAIEKAASHIKSGDVIIFPTDTVYGIGCRLFDNSAIKKIYNIKQRAKDKPLSAYISNLDMLDILCRNVPEEFYILAEKFLPGPLSIVLRKNDKVSKAITSGLDSIAVRITDNKFCQELISYLDEPLAGTSANKSGNNSSPNISDIPHEFDGKVSAIFDDGPCIIGTESTIISLSESEPIIIRQGPISKKDIEKVLNREIKILI
jgi:L-threonylcarbamoyladenylate synthase